MVTQRTFAAWVEQIARRDREARAELLDVARSFPADAWVRPSQLDGWSSRELLAHLAGDTGKWFAHILRSVLNGEPLDPARVGPGADVDALNRRDVNERCRRSVAELIGEIDLDGEEHQKLLSRLTNDHKDVRLALYSVSLGEFLSDKPAGSRGDHDQEHLAQMRMAAEEHSG